MLIFIIHSVFGGSGDAGGALPPSTVLPLPCVHTGHRVQPCGRDRFGGVGGGAAVTAAGVQQRRPLVALQPSLPVAVSRPYPTACVQSGHCVPALAGTALAASG